MERKPGGAELLVSLPKPEQEIILSDLVNLLKEHPLKHFSANRYLPRRATMVFSDLGTPETHWVFEQLKKDLPNLSETSQSHAYSLFATLNFTDPALLDLAETLLSKTKEPNLRDHLVQYLSTTSNSAAPLIIEKLLLRPDLKEEEKRTYLFKATNIESDDTVKMLDRLMESPTFSLDFKNLIASMYGNIPIESAVVHYITFLNSTKEPRPSDKQIDHLIQWGLDNFDDLPPALRGKLYHHLLSSVLKSKKPDGKLVVSLLRKLVLVKDDGQTLALVPQLFDLHSSSIERLTIEYLSRHPNDDSTKLLRDMLTETMPSIGKEFNATQSSQWFDRQALISGLLLKMGDKKEDVLDAISTIMADGFKTVGKQFPEAFIDQFEQSRGRISTTDSQDFERRIFDKLFDRELKGSPCDTACITAEKYANWAKRKYFETPDHTHTSLSWDFALSSLGILFIVKAGAYCNKVKPVADSLLSHFFPAPKIKQIPNSKPDTEFGQLQGLARSARAVTRDSKQFDKVIAYGKLFYIQLLREVKRAYQQSPDILLDMAEISNELDLTIDSLNEELEGFKKPKSLDDEGRGYFEPKNFNSMVSSHTGSYFETFMMSMTHLVVDLPKPAKHQLDEILSRALTKTDDPLRLVYGPAYGYSPENETRRAAAARAVPYFLSYYLRERNPEKKSQYADYLFAALKNHNEHSGSLIFHIARNSTHKPLGVVGYDGIAPYYYYPSATAASVAYKALEMDATFDNKELKSMEQEHLRKLRLLANKEGEFLVHGTERYPSAPAYVNPLAGLALLPYCDPHSWGIVDKDLVEQTPTKSSSLPTQPPKPAHAPEQQ